MSIARDRKLKARGYDYYTHARNLDEAKAIAAKQRSYGYKACAMNSDVGLVRGYYMGAEVWIKRKDYKVNPKGAQ